MSRSRNIKPGFFVNESLGECSPLSRILFIGLWCLADREGRLEDRPARIKASLLPYDNTNASELLDELRKWGFIIRYEISGAKFIQIVNFTKHQQPHYKEVASVIPSPLGWDDSGKTAGGVDSKTRDFILNRDGSCLSCGSTDNLSVYHIVPRSLGGSHDVNNLRTLCRKCNSSKNNRLQYTSDVEPTLSQHRLNVEPTKALDDTLNPDSLNPDSLNPDSLNPLTDSLNPLTDSLNPLTDAPDKSGIESDKKNEANIGNPKVDSPENGRPNEIPADRSPLPRVSEKPIDPKQAVEFELFRAEYPLKSHRREAIIAYASAISAGATHERIMGGVASLKNSISRGDTSFPSNPAKWLDDRGWENDYRPKKQTVNRQDGSRPAERLCPRTGLPLRGEEF